MGRREGSKHLHEGDDDAAVEVLERDAKVAVGAALEPHVTLDRLVLRLGRREARLPSQARKETDATHEQTTHACSARGPWACMLGEALGGSTPLDAAMA